MSNIFRWKSRNKKKHEVSAEAEELYDEYYAYYYAYYYDERTKAEAEPGELVETFPRPAEQSATQPLMSKDPKLKPDLSVMQEHTYRQQLKQMDGQLASVKHQLKYYQQTEATNALLIEQKRTLEIDYEDIKKKYSRLYQLRGKLQQRNEELTAELAAISEIDLASYRQLVDNHQQLKKQYALNDEVREKLVLQIHNLTQQLELAKEQHGALAQKTKTELQELASSYQEKLTFSSENEVKQKEKLAQLVAKNETIVAQQTEQATVLTTKEAEIQQLQATIAELHGQLAELMALKEAAAQESEEQLLAIQQLFETEVAALKQAHSLTVQEKVATDLALQEAQQTLAGESDSAEQQYHLLQSEVLTLQQTLTEQKERSALLQEEIALAEVSRQAERQQTEELRREFEALEEQYAQQAERLTQDSVALQAEATAIQAAVLAQETRENVLQAELTQAESALQVKTEQEAALQRALTALQAQSERQGESFDQAALAAGANVTTLQLRLDEAKKVELALQQELAYAQQQVEELTATTEGQANTMEEAETVSPEASLPSEPPVTGEKKETIAEVMLDAKLLARQMLEEAEKQQRLTDLNRETLKAELKLLRLVLLTKIQEADQLFLDYTQEVNDPF